MPHALLSKTPSKLETLCPGVAQTAQGVDTGGAVGAVVFVATLGVAILGETVGANVLGTTVGTAVDTLATVGAKVEKSVELS